MYCRYWQNVIHHQDVAFNQKVGDCLRTCDRNVPFQLETL